MIARAWHGRVPESKSESYYAYLLRTGLADYASTPGNRGVWVFRRTSDGVTEFLLTTMWDSIEAIKAFAGDDYERARYYGEDDEFLLEREEFVTHYECSISCARRSTATLAPRSDRAASSKNSASLRVLELASAGPIDLPPCIAAAHAAQRALEKLRCSLDRIE